MKIKELVLDLIDRMDFSESVEEKRDCPKCKEKKSVIRMIAMESNQGRKGRWYVERCTNKNCGYFDAGFI